eukprot:3802276-Prymnesium_polylepis.1
MANTGSMGNLSMTCSCLSSAQASATAASVTCAIQHGSPTVAAHHSSCINPAAACSLPPAAEGTNAQT